MFSTTRLLRVTQRAHGTWVLKVSERKVVNVETDERSWAPCFEICVSEGGRCECGTGKGISAIPIFQPLPSPFSNPRRPHVPTSTVPIFRPPPSPFSNLNPYNMCMCIYMCVCVDTYIKLIFIVTDTYIYIHIYLSLFIYLCAFIYIHIYIYIYLSLFIYYVFVYLINRSIYYKLYMYINIY